MFIKHLPLDDPYAMNRIGRPRLSTVGRGLHAMDLAHIFVLESLLFLSKKDNVASTFHRGVISKTKLMQNFYPTRYDNVRLSSPLSKGKTRPVVLSKFYSIQNGAQEKKTLFNKVSVWIHHGDEKKRKK